MNVMRRKNLKSYHKEVLEDIILKNILDVQSCVVKSHTSFPTHSLLVHFTHYNSVLNAFRTKTKLFKIILLQYVGLQFVKEQVKMDITITGCMLSFEKGQEDMEEVAILFECLQDKADCEDKEEEMDTKSVDENIEDLSTSFFSKVSERCQAKFSNKTRVN